MPWDGVRFLYKRQAIKIFSVYSHCACKLGKFSLYLTFEPISAHGEQIFINFIVVNRVRVI